jgi:biotin carboxylase
MGSLNNKRLLIIGAGPEQVPAYQLGKKLGLKLVGSDINPQAEAFQYADDAIIASTYDVQESLEAVKKYHQTNPIDGVITLASDVPMTVAVIAKELGLNSISIETAQYTSNKLVQLEKFKKDRLPIPDYRKITNIQQLKQIIEKWKLPLIIKPPDNRGSRGVLRLTDGIDIEWAFHHAASYSGANYIIAQKFLTGRQISSETVVYRGKCAANFYSSRNYEYLDKFSPYIIENGGGVPAQISTEEKKQLDKIVERVRKSLKVENGHIKGDLVITPTGEVKIIEFASRMGGGYTVSHSIPEAFGVNPLLANIKIALGLPLHDDELKINLKSAVALRFLFPKAGVVTKIKKVQKQHNSHSNMLMKIYVKEGDVIGEISDHTKRAGMVLTKAKSIEAAENLALNLINEIEIETK